MTAKRFPRTWRKASRWLSANCFWVRSSHQATARSKSSSGTTERRPDNRVIRCAISFLRSHQIRQKDQAFVAYPFENDVPFRQHPGDRKALMRSVEIIRTAAAEVVF